MSESYRIACSPNNKNIDLINFNQLIIYNFMTSWLEYEAMNKRRSQIKYYVNNLTLTHYCQIHLSNSPSLPSPYYLPSLPLYFLLFLIPVPLLPSSYTVCSFLPCTRSSFYHTIFPCIFFSHLSTPYFLSFLVPTPPFTILYFLECSSLYSLPRFLPCTHSSLYHTIFP